MARSSSFTQITQNLVAIFGERKHGTHERAAKMGRRRLKLVVHGANHADMWVWTDSPRRSSQGLIARIDLRDPGAVTRLHEQGITMM